MEVLFVDVTGAGAALDTGATALDVDDTGAGAGATLDVEAVATGAAAALLVLALDVATGLAEVVSVVDALLAPPTTAAGVTDGAGAGFALGVPTSASTATAPPAAMTPPTDAISFAFLDVKFTFPSRMGQSYSE